MIFWRENSDSRLPLEISKSVVTLRYNICPSLTMAAPSPDAKPASLPPPFTYTDPAPTLIAVGAEAHLYRTHFLDPSRPCALKHRPPKAWRHPVLDARLARHRVLAEARVLHKCRRAGVRVPGVLSLDWEGVTLDSDRKGGDEAGAGRREGGGGSRRSGAWLMMEWIEGRTVRRALDEWMLGQEEIASPQNARGEAELRALMVQMGKAVGRLHAAGVVHGDLTTSNLMLRPLPAATTNGTGEDGPHATRQRSLGGEIVLIDFGLAVQTVQDEDRAVDLYVLERAFGSTHPTIEDWFQEALQSYGASYKGGKVVLKKLEEVRMRGRKKSMLG